MTTEVKVPALPESVSDGVVVVWHKQPGDAIERDEALVDIETDKVVLEVPAPVDGVLEKILSSEGEQVTAAQVIGVIRANAAAAGITRARKIRPAALSTSLTKMLSLIRSAVAPKVSHQPTPKRASGRRTPVMRIAAARAFQESRRRRRMRPAQKQVARTAARWTGSPKPASAAKRW